MSSPDDRAGPMRDWPRGPDVAHTIIADMCEGIADCVPMCPTECIHWGEGRNGKGTGWAYIDVANCVGCGVCLSLCPIEGAIVEEWVPQYQRPRSRR